jgi:hypothetical protein
LRAERSSGKAEGEKPEERGEWDGDSRHDVTG